MKNIFENKERELWELYYPKVFGYFYKRVDNKTDVEDLTAVTMNNFLFVILDPEKNNSIKNPQAYLWKIANNQLVGFIKYKSKHLISVGINDNLDSLDHYYESTESSHHKMKINEMNRCLEESSNTADLEILKCLIIDDKSSKEVAIEFGLSDGNVRIKAHRLIQKLREACKDLWQICKY
jgi:RNA polymerase sigma factor (sigma-70 family)